MKTISNRKRYYIWITVFALTAGSICGCAKGADKAETTTAASGEEIELIDPVGVATYYDKAQYRDLYQADVYSCICCPSVTEFAYSTDAPFSKYGKLPGETIAAEDVLVYGDTTKLDEEYEQLAEDIQEKTQDYVDELTDLQEDLYDAGEIEYEVSVPHMESIAAKPEENSPFYDRWAMFSQPVEGMYREAVMAREKVEQSIKEKEELFALEQEYDKGCLERLAEKINQARVISNTEGTVVGVNVYYAGDYIQKNTSVIAVGDMTKKTLYTDYVSKATIAKAQDVYAIVDGKRYEVTYEVMEKEEYARLKKLNDVVYSTFYLHDPEDEVPMGKFVTLVVEKDSRKNTLAVLSDAVHRNGQEYYCYLYDGTGSVVENVTVGFSDGMYTEILSGLKEGDMVLTSEAVSAKGQTDTLKVGTIASEYSGWGILFYPSTEWLVNPAKHGTFYIKEICVEQNQQVKEGEELAKIEVIADQIGIGRLERKIQRQQERLNRLLEKKSKNYSNEIDRPLDRAIEARQKAIADYQEDLAELRQYSGEIVLTAPYDGIVTNITELDAGDMVSYNDHIIQIADQSLCYILVEDKDGQLSYGNEATITYVGEGSIKKEIKGTVVSVNQAALSKQLNIGVALILISREDIAEVAMYGSALGTGGGWNRNLFEVTVPIRGVDNVVLIPKKAVTVNGKNTFVKVKGQDGTITYVSFIAGGSDQNNYWAVDGLSEGMEICLE